MASAEIYKLADSENPQEEMLKKIGDLSNLTVGGAKVLVWVYIAPRKTKGGILRPDSNVKEDLYQGVVGYVLTTGPLAFKDDETNKFGGFSVKPGDWVTFRPADARRVQLKGVDCRIIEDVLIDMKIDTPEMITHVQ